jgi:DUF4097 and DUF4098 domain-containing protein YvlB
MKRLSLIIAYVLLTFTAAVAGFTLVMLTADSAYAGERTESNVNETRTAKPDGEVRIDNLAGTIKVRGWDKNQVQVTGTLGADVERLEVDSDGGGIDIRVILPHHSHMSEGDADLVINVPKGSRVEVSSVSADVDAMDVSGPQHVETVSGTVTLHSTSGDIDLRSTSGDVTITGSAAHAHIRASSVSGQVYVEDASGDLTAESVSGEVKVSHSRLSRAGVSSTSGDVRYESDLEKGGDYEFHTVSGDVTLSFNGAASARFDISSFSGDIDNSFGPRPTRVSKYSPGVELHFVNGSGEAQVSARTLSGDIKLHN